MSKIPKTPKIPNMTRRGSRWHIAFRHPLLAGYSENLVRLPAETSSDTEAMRIGLAIEQMRRDPRFHDLDARPEALILFPGKAVDAFYGPIKQDAQDNVSGAIIEIPPWASEESLHKVQEFEKFAEDALQWKQDAARWKARALRNEALLDLHNISVGSTVTCQQAYEAWKEKFRCRSERERVAVLRRVGYLVEALGSLSLSDLTQAQQVDEALKISMKKIRSVSKQKASSPYECYLRIRDGRRFLRFCNKEFRLYHLRDVIENLNCPTPQTIAKRKRVETLDMDAVERFLAGTGVGPFTTEPEHLYWKALVGTLIYSGLRLSELASLRWDEVELDNLIHVRQSKYKELKGGLLHERPVRPLPECWPHLRDLQPISKGYDWVFPMMKGATLVESNWLVRDFDKMIARPLTQRLGKLEKRIGLGRKIPSRARRTCQTLMLMRAPGQSKIINLQLGHSEGVGLNHYTDLEQVVRAFKWA